MGVMNLEIMAKVLGAKREGLAIPGFDHGNDFLHRCS